jgi:DNA-binding response OmpR family regulator
MTTSQTWILPGSNSYHVLLVEEDNEVAASLKDFLKLYACQVTRVTNAVEGLQRVMDTEFDAILCDMVTPSFPGDKFYIAVERIKPRWSERFIFMTGHTADPKWDAFIRSVHGLVLWRPFQMHELIIAIQTVLRRSRKQELQDWDYQSMGKALGAGREETPPGLRDSRQALKATAFDSIPPIQRTKEREL